MSFLTSIILVVNSNGLSTLNSIIENGSDQLKNFFETSETCEKNGHKLFSNCNNFSKKLIDEVSALCENSELANNCHFLLQGEVESNFDEGGVFPFMKSETFQSPFNERIEIIPAEDEDDCDFFGLTFDA